MNAQQYQNLNVIQEKIFYNNPNNLTSSGNSSSSSEEKEYISRSQLEAQMAKKQQLGRSLSAESTSVSTSPLQNIDGLSIPDHLNQPRRRDSGNWSGDRNSASSSSSTTLDNPYMFLMNKRNNNVPMPPSPTRTGQFYDAGYDSYSLSSTDSYPPKHPMNVHLAKIPESLPTMTGDCEKLCLEADQLLEKSNLVEDAHDFETALVLCNAAAGKARAAMNAPYSNPHTMTFARMKHNTCVMRARSLYRRILMEKGSEFAKDQVNANMMLNAPRHSRQNSKDKTMQRQNSKEMLHEDKPTIKNIEIYATLPKKKVSLKLVDQEDQIVAIEPAVETKKTEREGRSIFGRSKDSKEKRSRSEDRNKASRDFEVSAVIPAVLINAKDTLKKHKEEKDEKKDKDKSNKKQHKIRRKLLMGGLIRRKNRSMPDLTEGAADAQNKENVEANSPQKTVDDCSVGGSPKADTSTNSGYLSEGHLEYHVSNVNPSLERSKLMRKSFHGSGRQLVVAKVPPPPPLRKTSALTRELVEEHHMQQKNMSYNDEQPVMKPFHEQNMSLISNVSSNTSMSEDSCQTIITCAQVHQEQSPLKPVDLMPPPMHYQQKFMQSVDEVDHIVPHHSRFNSQLELPPYPSPPSTTCHSRQASDQDFPPPPPSIDLEPLNEQISEIQNLQIKRTDSLDTIQGCTSILAHLQLRQEAMKARDVIEKKPDISASYTSENWLKELQMKQLALKKMQVESIKATSTAESNLSNVASLASRFEQVKMSPVAELKRLNVRTGMNGLLSTAAAALAAAAANISTTPHTIKRMDNGEEVEYAIVDKKKNQLKFSEVSQSQVQEELREVEMLNQVVQNTLNNSNPIKRTKKKSVSFCDQVILVATANDDEDETFVPNPILERVLKSINNSSEDESKDQVDTPKSCVISTKQIPLQAPHESSPSSYMSPPINGLPMNKSTEDALGYQSIEQKPVYQSLPQQQTQIYPPPTQLPPLQQMSLPRSGVQQQNYHEMMRKADITSVGSPPQHMSMAMSNQYAGNMQQPFDYVANQGSGLTNLGIPLQSPYMQMPQNSSVVRDNYLSYNPNLNRPLYPQNPLAQMPAQQQQQPNQMQMNHYMMNARMYQANVYQKPPQMMQQAHEFHPYQSPYQRIPYDMPFEPPSMPLPQQQQLPLNPMNPLSPLHQTPNSIYLSPPQMMKPMQKKVSFGPDTKGGSDGNNSPAPSSTSSTSDANNNNNNIAVMSPTQMIPTKVAFNNNSIVKSTAKSTLCNLCRKQHAIGTSLYCANCDSYLARFNGTVRR